MADAKSQHPKWPYYAAALCFLAIGYSLGWVGKDILVIPSFVAALVCAALANLDRFKSFKAAGVEAILRDAQVAVQESREQALVMSKMLLALVKRTGRWGGFSAAEEKDFQESVDRILTQFDASEAERREAHRYWDRFEGADYVFAILGSSTVPNFQVPAHVGKTEEWKALRGRAADANPPSPDELTEFLVRHGFVNPMSTELIEDYRYFLQHRKHRRPESWAQRKEWQIKRLGE